MPLQPRARDRVGLLPVDAPIFQFVERYPRFGHRATHIGPRRNHAEIAVQILHVGFAMARGTEFVQQDWTLRSTPAGRAGPGVSQNAIYHKYVTLSARQTHRFVMN